MNLNQIDEEITTVLRLIRSKIEVWEIRERLNERKIIIMQNMVNYSQGELTRIKFNEIVFEMCDETQSLQSIQEKLNGLEIRQLVNIKETMILKNIWVYIRTNSTPIAIIMNTNISQTNSCEPISESLSKEECNKDSIVKTVGNYLKQKHQTLNLENNIDKSIKTCYIKEK